MREILWSFPLFGLTGTALCIGKAQLVIYTLILVTVTAPSGGPTQDVFYGIGSSPTSTPSQPNPTPSPSPTPTSPPVYTAFGGDGTEVGTATVTVPEDLTMQAAECNSDFTEFLYQSVLAIPSSFLLPCLLVTVLTIGQVQATTRLIL